MAACGLTSATTPQIAETDFFTSHEALLLQYEEALTRVDSTSGDWYDCSAHMLWIGDRTRQPDGAHVEFLRGVAQPDRLQVRPDAVDRRHAEADRRAQPGQRARPHRHDRPHGRRQGGREAAAAGPRREARRASRWSGRAIPMHGNTVKASNGCKTRHFDRILSEVTEFFAVHRAEGTHPGGVHFEMTGQDVTECIGGATDDHRRQAERPLRDPLRPAPQRQPGAGAGLPARRAAQGRAPVGPAGAPGRITAQLGRGEGQGTHDASSKRRDRALHRSLLQPHQAGDRQVRRQPT